MTRLEIHIDELVLHGMPLAYRDALPALLEQRLAELASGTAPDAGGPPVPGRGPDRAAASAGRENGPQRVTGVGELADVVARSVWAQAAPSGWSGRAQAPGGA